MQRSVFAKCAAVLEATHACIYFLQAAKAEHEGHVTAPLLYPFVQSTRQQITLAMNKFGSTEATQEVADAGDEAAAAVMLAKAAVESMSPVIVHLVDGAALFSKKVIK